LKQTGSLSSFSERTKKGQGETEEDETGQNDDQQKKLT
jgi:hypothetical protein